MGEFDCYCCLCSGPLVPIEIGSSSRNYLNRRRRRVSRKLAAIEAGRSFDSFDSDSEHESDEDPDEEDGNGEEEEVVYEQDERRSYDPEIVSEGRVAWVENVRVLGVDTGGKGEGSRAFISGPANYDDAGLIYVQQGDDPNQPSIDEKPFFDCYVSSNDNEVVFPFHSHCMTILEEAFQWSFNLSRDTKKSLDLNTLYKTALRIGGLTNLNLDYGGITGVDQCWECIPGEEFSVIDPLTFNLTTLNITYNPTTTTTKQSTLPLLRTRPIIDPFHSLPTEILYLICKNLPAHDLQSFLTASSTAYYSTLDQGFWKTLCLSRLPWAWEVWRDIKDEDISQKDVSPEQTGEVKEVEKMGQGVDYKRLYLCLDINTTQRFGLGVERRSWMGLVNRRRIWDCCVEVLGEYWRDFWGVRKMD